MDLPVIVFGECISAGTLRRPSRVFIEVPFDDGDIFGGFDLMIDHDRNIVNTLDRASSGGIAAKRATAKRARFNQEAFPSSH